MSPVIVNRNPEIRDQEKILEGNAIYHIKNNMYTT